MKFNKQRIFNIPVFAIISLLLIVGCNPPEKKKKTLREKHNYIVLLDLSDRLIVQNNQPDRDIQIVKQLYDLFETKVKRDLYIKSRDEIKVVIAPQLGSGLRREVFEDRLYINMENIKNIFRKRKEAERKNDFMANLDTLYNEAEYSKTPEDYHGADIWKYFYEDLKVDYSKDTLTQNYLFILTDGYPIVGKKQVKLNNIENKFNDLHIILLEASPREKDMEWDRIMGIWENWFDQIGVKEYTLIKRGAITKELEQVKEILTEKEV